MTWVHLTGFCLTSSSPTNWSIGKVMEAFGPSDLERQALEIIMKEAKRRAAKQCHPDINPNGAELMTHVNKIIDEIKDYYGM